jgi:hypothetical protein
MAHGALRTVLDVKPLRDGGTAGATSRVIGALSDMVSEVSGKVITSGAEAVVTSRERQAELEARWITWLPSSLQFAYLGSMVLGLFGLPVALGWWRRIWPPEAREEYGNGAGYQAARVVRGLIGFLLFVPLVAIASAPLQVVKRGWSLATAPLRWWRAVRSGPAAASSTERPSS